MALPLPSRSDDRKRVKVYELKDNDWFDRGTGLCNGQLLNDEPIILVEAEDDPGRMLLKTKVNKDDGYQRQQDTLIVWTEPSGTDMALSFQEAEGCASIWNFVISVRGPCFTMDEGLSEDALDGYSRILNLPDPTLDNLEAIEKLVRAASFSQMDRDTLTSCVLRENYIAKLLPLVTEAEQRRRLPELHWLCNIMKSLILLNDNDIVERVVSDEAISGVVGALEYDPEFPTHKANHRQYLNDQSRYREVVPIQNPEIRFKIRQTWRLQYLKDVVLARILDDPTFSVLNSLIFFNQVEIVHHLQNNAVFLNELFAVFELRQSDSRKKEDAVQFLHQCAAIAKNLQLPARTNLYANFINHGLFSVIAFAIKHPSPSMRTTGIDLLNALLEHDPVMMRSYMLKAITDNRVPLTDMIIDLLHVEGDLGVKNQLAEAVKIFLDPSVLIQDPPSRETPKLRNYMGTTDMAQRHFEESARKLFVPLKQLESRQCVSRFTFQEAALYSHLVDILSFFVRQHPGRSKMFMYTESLTPRVAQLLLVSQKHLKLTALKFFRTLVGISDTFYMSQMTQHHIFAAILDIIFETMPKDNLLNSACLELFGFVKRESIKAAIVHVVGEYRERIGQITYVDIFHDLISQYDQIQGQQPHMRATLISQEDPAQSRVNGTGPWQGIRGMDAVEEEYFETSDEEEEEHPQKEQAPQKGPQGLTPKPLVDYPDEDEDSNADMETDPTSATAPHSTEPSEDVTMSTSASQIDLASQRFSEKRRREDDDDDELMKLSSGTKRRGSVSSNTSDSPPLQRQSSSSSLSSAVGPNNGVDAESAPTKAERSPSLTGEPKRIAINFGASAAARRPNGLGMGRDRTSPAGRGDGS